MPDLYFVVNSLDPGSENIITIINVGIVLFNVLISFIVNFLLFGRRRKNERSYQVSLRLFEKLILDRSDIVFEIFEKLDTLFNTLYSSIHDSTSKEKLLELTQNKIAEFYKIQDSFENKIRPYMGFYSHEFFEEIKSIFDNYFDCVPTYLSEIPSIDELNELEAIKKKLNTTKIEIIQKLHNVLKKYMPTP